MDQCYECGQVTHTDNCKYNWEVRAKKAESEVSRLRAILKEIAGSGGEYHWTRAVIDSATHKGQAKAWADEWQREHPSDI